MTPSTPLSEAPLRDSRVLCGDGHRCLRVDLARRMMKRDDEGSIGVQVGPPITGNCRHPMYQFMYSSIESRVHPYLFPVVLRLDRLITNCSHNFGQRRRDCGEDVRSTQLRQVPNGQTSGRFSSGVTNWKIAQQQKRITHPKRMY